MKRITFKEDQLKLFYKKYKEYIIPSGIILISFLLFFFVVIPQFQNFLIIRSESEKESQKLQVLKSNLNKLNSLSDSVLDNQLKVARKAMPENKDFISMLNAVAISAAKSDVTLADFEFNVGDITTNKKLSSFPQLELLLNISGDLNGLAKFYKELEKTIPVSEISSIRNSGEFSTISIIFYYKPFSPINMREESPIQPVSDKDAKLLDSIMSWNNIQTQQSASSTTQSSESGTFSNPF